jgi:uncharacterized phage-associated protein
MASAIDVAAYILELVGSVTTMKLQKLVYYTQARYLVMNGIPLFSNRIEAWANGPVAPDLFHAHSGKYMIGRGSLGSMGSSSALSEPQRKAAEKVVELFGSYSGEQLRELTHNEAPWVDARKGYGPGDRCEVEITVDAMRSYYASPACPNPVGR